ncbi:hypothetical protein F5X97DRAFT_121621 [Nemania serpens]|nr:hypothetical protein F5X97DRAFT_121621 [Nemania serpens]
MWQAALPMNRPRPVRDHVRLSSIIYLLQVPGVYLLQATAVPSLHYSVACLWLVCCCAHTIIPMMPVTPFACMKKTDDATDGKPPTTIPFDETRGDAESTMLHTA